MQNLAVVFDTNAYRALSDQALAELREYEVRAGVHPYASYWVVIELLAHMALKDDPDFGSAIASLKRLWTHCSVKSDDRELLQFLADSENQLCKAIFGEPIPKREAEAEAYAQIVSAVVHSKSPEAWSHYQPALDYLRDHVEDVEQQFVEDMWDHVVRGLDPSAGSWHPLHDEPELRKHLAQAITSDIGRRLCARMVVRKAALQIDRDLSQESVDAKVDFVTEVFPTPLALYNEIVRRIILDGCDLRRRNRANWIWDMQMAFQTSPAAALQGVPVWLITGDGDIRQAAAAVGADDVVKSVNEYRDSVSKAAA